MTRSTINPGVGLVLLVTLLAIGCTGLSEAEEHYNAGVDLQDQGRLQEAIAEYDESCERLPQDSELTYVPRFLEPWRK